MNKHKLTVGRDEDDAPIAEPLKSRLRLLRHIVTEATMGGKIGMAPGTELNRMVDEVFRLSHEEVVARLEMYRLDLITGDEP